MGFPVLQDFESAFAIYAYAIEINSRVLKYLALENCPEPSIDISLFALQNNYLYKHPALQPLRPLEEETTPKHLAERLPTRNSLDNASESAPLISVKLN